MSATAAEFARQQAASFSLNASSLLPSSLVQPPPVPQPAWHLRVPNRYESEAQWAYGYFVPVDPVRTRADPSSQRTAFVPADVAEASGVDPTLVVNLEADHQDVLANGTQTDGGMTGLRSEAEAARLARERRDARRAALDSRSNSRFLANGAVARSQKRPAFHPYGAGNVTPLADKGLLASHNINPLRHPVNGPKGRWLLGEARTVVRDGAIVSVQVTARTEAETRAATAAGRPLPPGSPRPHSASPTPRVGPSAAAAFSGSPTAEGRRPLLLDRACAQTARALREAVAGEATLRRERRTALGMDEEIPRRSSSPPRPQQQQQRHPQRPSSAAATPRRGGHKGMGDTFDGGGGGGIQRSVGSYYADVSSSGSQAGVPSSGGPSLHLRRPTVAVGSPPAPPQVPPLAWQHQAQQQQQQAAWGPPPAQPQLQLQLPPRRKEGGPAPPRLPASQHQQQQQPVSVAAAAAENRAAARALRQRGQDSGGVRAQLTWEEDEEGEAGMQQHAVATEAAGGGQWQWEWRPVRVPISGASAGPLASDGSVFPAQPPPPPPYRQAAYADSSIRGGGMQQYQQPQQQRHSLPASPFVPMTHPERDPLSYKFLPPAWTAAIPPAGMPSARRQAAQQGRGGRPSSAAAAAVPDAQASVADLLNQYD